MPLALTGKCVRYDIGNHQEWHPHPPDHVERVADPSFPCLEWKHDSQQPNDNCDADPPAAAEHPLALLEKLTELFP